MSVLFGRGAVVLSWRQWTNPRKRTHIMRFACFLKVLPYRKCGVQILSLTNALRVNTSVVGSCSRRTPLSSNRSASLWLSSVILRATPFAAGPF